MTELDRQRRDKHLHQLAHDVRNSLQVVGMGSEVLKTARGDDVKFAQVCEWIEAERKTALRLVDELLKAACEDGADG
ncbi:MAG TPA: hypothetical protein VFG50_11875 [Rhodothermales bacterium]|nr:hypothetical protein [Rhodothermales bacterium]